MEPNLEGFLSEHDPARLIALTAPHWLFALPITPCGLRLSDEAIRVAVGLRLGLNISEPHTCPCGADVCARGTYGHSCKESSGRSTRHHQVNDLIWRYLRRSDIPATKEPTGFLRGDGKRPDGLTLVPWKSGRCIIWDATVVNTFASSYVASTSSTPGTAAEAAARRKLSKYSKISQTHFHSGCFGNHWTYQRRRSTLLVRTR